MRKKLTNAEILIYCTVRIECDLGNNRISTGTGFFFDFPLENGMSIPTLITNKHVIEGATKGKYFLTLADEFGNPIKKKYEAFEYKDFQAGWIRHPEDEVDLCILPIANVIKMAQQNNKPVFRTNLYPSLIPTEEQIAALTGIEEILMVGYPNGIWDEINNLPITRRGITATHPYFDYEGKKEFMIDAACFPGSSGSPVFIFNQGSYINREGSPILGTRVFFIGVLYAGPQHITIGKIESDNIPISDKIKAISKIPNNLGVVIKAEKVMDFEPILKNWLSQ